LQYLDAWLGHEWGLLYLSVYQRAET
jgi:hypothetical protein